MIILPWWWLVYFLRIPWLLVVYRKWHGDTSGKILPAGLLCRGKGWPERKKRFAFDFWIFRAPFFKGWTFMMRASYGVLCFEIVQSFYVKEYHVGTACRRLISKGWSFAFWGRWEGNARKMEQRVTDLMSSFPASPDRIFCISHIPPKNALQEDDGRIWRNSLQSHLCLRRH